MQLHELRLRHKKKRRKRVGRGGKRGTYSGRGVKGQKSRAGRRLKPVIRELIKKYPKLRGYKFRSRTKIQKPKITILNLDVLEKKFTSGEKINPAVLMKKGLIRRIRGKVPKVKILGKGKLTKALTVEGCQASKQAKERIEKAAGQVI